MSQHIIRALSHRRASIVREPGDQLVCIGQLRSNGDHGIGGDYSHNVGSVVDGRFDDISRGIGSLNLAGLQFRNTPAQPIDLIDPGPFKTDRPGGYAGDEAPVRDSSDRRLNRGRGKTWQVLIHGWIA